MEFSKLLNSLSRHLQVCFGAGYSTLQLLRDTGRAKTAARPESGARSSATISKAALKVGRAVRACVACSYHLRPEGATSHEHGHTDSLSGRHRAKIIRVKERLLWIFTAKGRLTQMMKAIPKSDLKRKTAPARLARALCFRRRKAEPHPSSR